jgi:broad specificity phosphatase PhoE
MTVVYLLRHGATASNRVLPYRLQGRGSDQPLDRLGVAQAERAAEALAGVEFAAAYTSPLLRATETARIVARPHELEPIVVPQLVEAELGRWEGLTWDEAHAQDPDQFQRFMANPGTVPYPGGESFLDVQIRVAPALAELASAHEGTSIVVVGHNVVNRAFLAGVLGLPIDRARALRQANGGYNVIHYDHETIELVTLNSCLHTMNVGFD